MQITAEKVDNDIRGLEIQIEQLRGALTVLLNMKSYLAKKEEEEQETAEVLPVSLKSKSKSKTAESK